MNVAFIGNKQATDEMKEKLGNRPVLYVNSDEDITDLSQFDLILDTRMSMPYSHYSPWEIASLYAPLQGKVVLLGVVHHQLAKLKYYHNEPFACHFAAFNSLPTFINRPLWEVSVLSDADLPPVDAALTQLGIGYRRVNDRVGMVMPRIICMIINEAFYTLQEGTASVEDINLSMKLGTGYPYGPFEWLEKLGVGYVYNILNELYLDTRDERYKICPLLKTQYMLAQS